MAKNRWLLSGKEDLNTKSGSIIAAIYVEDQEPFIGSLAFVEFVLENSPQRENSLA